MMLVGEVEERTIFRVRSEIAGFELVSEELDGEMLARFEEVSGLAESRGVYRLRTLGEGSVFVRPKVVEFVFRDIASLPPTQQRDLAEKYVGEKDKIIRAYGNEHEVETGVMRDYIYYDIDYLTVGVGMEGAEGAWSFSIMNLLYLTYYPLGYEIEAGFDEIGVRLRDEVYEMGKTLVKIKRQTEEVSKASVGEMIANLAERGKQWLSSQLRLEVLAQCRGRWVCEGKSTSCGCPDGFPCTKDDPCLPEHGGGWCTNCQIVCGGTTKWMSCLGPDSFATCVQSPNRICPDGYCNPRADDICWWEPPTVPPSTPPPPGCGGVCCVSGQCQVNNNTGDDGTCGAGLTCCDSCIQIPVPGCSGVCCDSGSCNGNTGEGGCGAGQSCCSSCSVVPPPFPPYGSVRIFAFLDVNKNGRFDSGDSLLPDEVKNNASVTIAPAGIGVSIFNLGVGTTGGIQGDNRELWWNAGRSWDYVWQAGIRGEFDNPTVNLCGNNICPFENRGDGVNRCYGVVGELEGVPRVRCVGSWNKNGAITDSWFFKDTLFWGEYEGMKMHHLWTDRMEIGPSGNWGGVNYRSPTRFTVELPKDYQVSVLRWAEPQSSALEISNKTKTNGDDYLDASITCDYCGQGGSRVSTNLLVVGVKDKFIPPEVINYSAYPFPEGGPNTEAVVCNTNRPTQTVTFYGSFRDLNGSWYLSNQVVNHGFEDGWVKWRFANFPTCA